MSQTLRQEDRYAERVAALSELAANGSTLDRAWAWIGIGLDRSQAGDLPGAAAAGREAIRLEPDLGLAWRNLALVERNRGRDEQSLEQSAGEMNRM